MRQNCRCPKGLVARPPPALSKARSQTAVGMLPRLLLASSGIAYQTIGTWTSSVVPSAERPSFYDVEKCQRQRKRVGDVVRLRCAFESEQPRHHRVDLLFARAPRAEQRALDARVAEGMHRNAGLRAG